MEKDLGRKVNTRTVTRTSSSMSIHMYLVYVISVNTTFLLWIESALTRFLPLGRSVLETSNQSFFSKWNGFVVSHMSKFLNWHCRFPCFSNVAASRVDHSLDPQDVSTTCNTLLSDKFLQHVPFSPVLGTFRPAWALESTLINCWKNSRKMKLTYAHIQVLIVRLKPLTPAPSKGQSCVYSIDWWMSFHVTSMFKQRTCAGEDPFHFRISAGGRSQDQIGPNPAIWKRVENRCILDQIDPFFFLYVTKHVYMSLSQKIQLRKCIDGFDFGEKKWHCEPVDCHQRAVFVLGNILLAIWW